MLIRMAKKSKHPMIVRITERTTTTLHGGYRKQFCFIINLLEGPGDQGPAKYIPSSDFRVPQVHIEYEIERGDQLLKCICDTVYL